MKRSLVSLVLLVGVLAQVRAWADSLPPSNSCTANVTAPGRVSFSWIPVADAQSYAIFRDGILLGTFSGAPPTVWVDFPPPGTHRYCVVAQAPGFTSTDSCCSRSPSAYPPATPSCEASTDPSGKVLLHWSPVDGATGYTVTRDNVIVYHAGPDETSYTAPDDGISTYCVRALDALGTSDPCCVQGLGIGGSSEGRWRLSWGTCTPQISNQDFAGPAFYELDLSVEGVSHPVVGNDTYISIYPGVPDAWRFDAAGCQTSEGLAATPTALGKSCPALLGTHPLTLLSYYLSSAGDGSAVLRLAVTYDTFTPDPSKRYVLWKISFDHRYSVAGTASDPLTCGGAGQTLQFLANPTFLLANNMDAVAAPEPGDMPLRWNGDHPVATVPATWGRLKSLYH